MPPKGQDSPTLLRAPFRLPPGGLFTADLSGTGIPLGLILGPVAILLAAYSLVLDFDYVQQGVRSGAPRLVSWRAAFGLALTIVSLYVEQLCFISILRE